MPVWLNVAEKPSVAKQIQLTLSGGRSETVRSSSRFNPVFQFTYRGSITMLVTSVAGHVTEEDFTGAAKIWKGFPLRELFTAPITKCYRESVKDIKENIENLMRRADTLVLWLDCDREGENICFEVVEIARKAVKRNFSVKRAHFSALTQRDIQFAMDHLREPDARLSEAVEARKEMDLRIGAAFTRFQTLRLRDAVSSLTGVISFGTCQFPALGFVVRREWERQGFLPEEYFTMRLYHTKTTFVSVRGAMYDQVGATLIYEDMLLRAVNNSVSSPARAGDAKHEREEGSIDGVYRVEVVNVRQNQNHRRQPFPLSTVMMQKLAATNLHMSSEKSMKIAELLYQEGYLSYPRTETNHFTFTKEELLDLVKIQTGNHEVGAYAERMLQETSTRFCTPLNGGQDDKAHPPIHPTKLFNSSLPTDEKNGEKMKLYQLIVKHFLACLSPPAVDAQTTVTVVCGGEEFTASGSTVVSPGWTEVFPYAQRSSTLIPNYQLHETFIPTSILLEKSVTSPPPRLTETALISAMDENGIGTDATIAQHIKTLIDRQYMKRVGQSMEPTFLGMALAAAYEAMGLSSLLQPQLRAQMEAAMGDIALGKATRKDVVDAAVSFYREVFDRLAAREKDFLQIVFHFMRQGGENDPTESYRFVSGELVGCLPDGEGGIKEPFSSCTANGFSINSTAPNFLTDVQVVERAFGQCGHCQNALVLVESTQENSRRFVQCQQCTTQFRLPNTKYVTIAVYSPLVKCPLCQFSVLEAESRERHTKYTFCPYCFQHPPPPSVNISTDIESIGMADFRCAQCVHPSCELAKGKENIGITKCISCKTNELRLRQTASGSKYVLSCSGYPTCSLRIGLPKASRIEVVFPTQRCTHCQALMLCFDFRGVQPVPGLEEVEVVCVQCDIRLKEYLVILQPGSRITNEKEDNRDLIRSFNDQTGIQRSAQPYTLPSIHSLNSDAGRRGTTTSGQHGVVSNSAKSNDGVVHCGCGVPAKQLVSRKSNSYGKAFRTCASRKCGFFEWCE